MRSPAPPPAALDRPRSEPAVPRRRLARRGLGGLLAVVCLAGASTASAQNDINQKLPDVLLLVDTSGSMEYKVGSTAYPACYPDGSSASERSRWIDLVEVLTGTISDYRCEDINRESLSFRDGEYGTSGPLATAPYDYLYRIPYHRPLSGACARAPGTLTSNVWEFPNTAFKEHPYNSVGSTCSTPFAQSNDGIMDAFERAIRFGLMTFDPVSGDGVVGSGYTGTSTPAYADGVKGTWSYVWGTPRVGKPAGCTVDQPFEVGARNAAAPPWEGRLIPFGNPQSDEYLTKKEQIKKVLLATRPYGPTPIAGLLHDARDFLTLDTTKDPLDATQDFGPYNDPFIKDTNTTSGCRKRYVILLSDGQPNTDLRPECGTSASTNCPFSKAEDIALKMKSPDPGERPIETFVIGFALSKFTVKDKGEISCNDLDDADFAATGSGLCNSTDADNLANTALQACCSLNRIAVAGGTGEHPRAVFADSRDQLSSALSLILTRTTTVTSRTQPVMAGGAAGSQGFRFYSSVRPITFQPWVGILERQRYECNSSHQPVAMPIKADKQDDFAANINEHPDTRYFSSIRGGNGSEPVYSERTIRPHYAVVGTPDGGGVYGGSRYVAQRDTFVSDTSAEMIKVDNTICTNPALNANDCRDRYMKWLVGLANGTLFSRCNPKTLQCYLMGDILHSTPRVVAAPSSFVVDESYQKFTRGVTRVRPVVLYTSTNDGFLHAFKVATSDTVTDPDTVTGPGTKNNELWAFVPPAILPQLRKQYPFTHQALLDGAPQVLDVVATEPADPNNLDSMRFERTKSDAKHGVGTWRTVLLQSFGTQSPAGGGYFALDITNPTLDAGNLNDSTRGPRFLWQVTTDVAGRALFGKGATPTITTLFFDPTGGNDPKEIPVAILPGGAGQPGTLGPSPGFAACPGTPNTFPNFEKFAPRQQVRCYTAADTPARSLTVVRLDTGEIVRTFRKTVAEILDTDLQKLVITAPLDSPIAGDPVAFPAGTAAISDRVYVGDQDGRLWKADFSSANPSNWTMNLFFDAFPATSQADASFTHSAGAGQTLMLPPVVSIDANGDVTVAIATGDQDTTTATTTAKNYVWSLTEKTSGDRTTSTTHVNWFTPLTAGERVVGPMSLFNSQLFFSTYAPPSAALLSTHACASGKSKVWGMDYLRAVDDDNLALGGQPRMPGDPDQVQSLTAAEVANDSDAVIFGVSVAQQPSCTETGDSTADAFLGYKSERTITHVTPGKFQLVMHFGGVDTASVSDDRQANVATIDLEPPASAARIDSWAALLE